MLKFIAIFLYFYCITALPINEWKKLTIYQVLTDRFARSDGSTQSCPDITDYCDGTYKGLIRKLPYIKALGFDAIWISPIVKNYPRGFHGYWAIDLYNLNSHFGTADDLKDLSKALHDNGMYLMVDVVANHFTADTNSNKNNSNNIPIEDLVPFNKWEYYHDCNTCSASCTITNWQDEYNVEHCRLAGNLLDLDQDNEFVRSQLLNWIKNIVQEYSIDGLRIDTVPEVKRSFWTEFQNAANVFAVGEVFNGDVGYVASFQGPKGKYLNSVLSYPLYFAFRQGFVNQESLRVIESLVGPDGEYRSRFTDIDALGTFVDNHDNPRFLSEQSDLALYKNALMFSLFCEGIPIIYYGTEQHFNGGSDPYDREAMFPTEYSTNTDLYMFLRALLHFRKEKQVWNYKFIQRYADDNFYAFTRGSVLLCFTNVGSHSEVKRPITYHDYAEGTVLTSLLDPSDTVTVKDGKIDIELELGQPKLYYPSNL